ncbi:IncL/M-type plasmid replication leader peptide RepB, partial [Klebsiella pneumoniae]
MRTLLQYSPANMCRG